MKELWPQPACRNCPKIVAAVKKDSSGSLDSSGYSHRPPAFLLNEASPARGLTLLSLARLDSRIQRHGVLVHCGRGTNFGAPRPSPPLCRAMQESLLTQTTARLDLRRDTSVLKLPRNNRLAAATVGSSEFCLHLCEQRKGAADTQPPSLGSGVCPQVPKGRNPKSLDPGRSPSPAGSAREAEGGVRGCLPGEQPFPGELFQ